MNKKKRTGSNPLNEMFPQIQDTREQKEKDVEKEQKEAEKEETISGSEEETKSEEVVDESQEQSNQEDSPASESNGSSTITIPKKRKTGEYIRMTYYFRPDQLKELDKLHKQSGRDKSELVRLAVDILIEQAKIE